MRRDITGGTSPWIYLSEEYPGGVRTILYSNSTHIFKFIDDGTALLAVDSFRLDFNTLTSNGYNHLLSKNRIWFSYEPTYDPADNRYSRLFKFSDADTTDPYSPIVTLDTLDFGDYGINSVNMYNLNYNGEIVWYSEEDEVNNIAYAGVIDQGFNMLELSIPMGPEEDFPDDPLYDQGVNHVIDEDGSIYYSGSRSLVKLQRFPRLTSVKGAERAAPEFIVYPNPAGNAAWVDGISLEGNAYRIFSAEGRCLKQATIVNQRIDLSGVPDGLVFVQFVVGGQLVTKKVIKASQE